MQIRVDLEPEGLPKRWTLHHGPMAGTPSLPGGSYNRSWWAPTTALNNFHFHCLLWPGIHQEISLGSSDEGGQWVDKCYSKKKRKGAGGSGGPGQTAGPTAVLKGPLRKVRFEWRLEIGEDLAMQGNSEFQAAGIVTASEEQDPTETSGRGHRKIRSLREAKGRGGGGLKCLC